MKKIDLGRKMDSLPAEPMQTKRDEKTYPTLWLEESDGVEFELPNSGTMTISFKVTEKTEREDKDGKSCSYRVEVQSIDEVKADETDEPEDTTERDFDKAVTNYSKTTVHKKGY